MYEQDVQYLELYKIRIINQINISSKITTKLSLLTNYYQYLLRTLTTRYQHDIELPYDTTLLLTFTINYQ